jgi:hypothetical protein
MMSQWTEIPCNVPIPGIRAFQRGSIRALVSKDAGSWHISVSHPHRYPKWDEIRQARYDLVPNEAYMVMVLPPAEDYVNVHENCFHLREISKVAYEGKA